MRKRDSRCIAARPPLLDCWCTGEDSNLRSSKERQIYSLLPLTTRPPVHNLPKPSPATQATHQSPGIPGRNDNWLMWSHCGGQCLMLHLLLLETGVRKLRKLELAKGLEPPTV